MEPEIMMGITDSQARKIWQGICEGWTEFTAVEAEAAVLSCLRAYPPCKGDHGFLMSRTQSDGSGEIRNMLVGMQKENNKLVKKVEYVLNNIGFGDIYGVEGMKSLEQFMIDNHNY